MNVEKNWESERYNSVLEAVSCLGIHKSETDIIGFSPGLHLQCVSSSHELSVQLKAVS